MYLFTNKHLKDNDIDDQELATYISHLVVGETGLKSFKKDPENILENITKIPRGLSEKEKFYFDACTADHCFILHTISEEKRYSGIKLFKKSPRDIIKEIGIERYEMASESDIAKEYDLHELYAELSRDFGTASDMLRKTLSN